MTRAPYESVTAPTSHSATDPAEFNVVCRSKSNLQNQTDSNAALLPYLSHQLGSVHEWSGVWNGASGVQPKYYCFEPPYAHLKLEEIIAITE